MKIKIKPHIVLIVHEFVLVSKNEIHHFISHLYPFHFQVKIVYDLIFKMNIIKTLKKNPIMIHSNLNVSLHHYRTPIVIYVMRNLIIVKIIMLIYVVHIHYFKNNSIKLLYSQFHQ